MIETTGRGDVKKLQGKVAIVTGASRGVGEYMAVELAKVSLWLD